MTEKRIAVWVQRFKDRPHLVLQWLDPDTGKRKSQSAMTSDPEIAEQKRGDLESDLNNGRHQEASRMSWEKFRELFEAEYAAGLRQDTQRNYASTLDLFEKICNPQSIRRINERTVSLFVAGMRKLPGRKAEEMMPSTIKVRLQFFGTVLRWAAQQKFIPSVPKFPTVKVPKSNPQPVPAEAFEKLLAKAPDRMMRTYLLCGWLTGLRLSEAHALEWEQTDKAPWVDLDGNRIWLPGSFVKGARDQWVPLDPQLRKALLALPRQGRRVFRFPATFACRSGELLDAGAVSQRVAALAKKAGVRLTMKTLRTGFACRYASKVPAQVLQKLMRHASIKTTMDYYANVDDAAMNAVLGQCNDLCNIPPAEVPAESTDSVANP